MLGNRGTQADRQGGTHELGRWKIFLPFLKQQERAYSSSLIKWDSIRITSGSSNLKINRYMMLICFKVLPKLDPPAVPVRYLYNLCSHTSSLMIPDPMWGRLGFSLWRRNLLPLCISRLLSVLQLTRVRLLQVYNASGCLPRLDSVILISCHFSISINILSD